MKLKCIIVKEIMFICFEETNHVFLLSVRQAPIPRRTTPAPTPGRFALISSRNNVDQNQFSFFTFESIHVIFHKEISKTLVFNGRKGQAFGLFF